MKRIYSGTVKDDEGNIIADATIAVYLGGTGTAASIYLDPDSDTKVTGTTSDSYGRYVFYVSAFDYDSDQTFKILISKTGYVTNTIDHISIEDVVAQAYTISADTTVTTHVKIPKGVTYAIATGKTLTFSGEFEAGKYQVFSGAGTAVFGSVAVKEVYPEWWGENTTPGTTDMAAKIQAAINTGKTVYLSNGIYLIKTALTATTPFQRIVGNGLQTIISSTTTDIFDLTQTEILDPVNGICIEKMALWTTFATGVGIKMRLLHRSTFKDLLIGAGGKCIYVFGGVINTFDNCIVGNIRPDSSLSYIDGTNGIYLEQDADNLMEANANRFINCSIEDINGTGIYIGEGTINNIFSGCTVEGCDDYGAYIGHANATVRVNVIENSYFETNGIDIYVTPSSSTHLSGLFLNSDESLETSGGINGIRINNVLCRGVVLGAGLQMATINGLFYGYGDTTTFTNNAYHTTITNLADHDLTNRFSNGPILTLTVNAAEPSVIKGSFVYKTANTSETVISSFTNGIEGDKIVVIIGDANTIIDFTGTTLKGNEGANWSPTTNDWMECVFDGTNWFCSCHDCTA
jgi:hypothetical protein